MKQILRVGLMVLLAAVLGVGSAWGEKKEYTDGNGITWEYEEIEEGATCSIGIPKNNRGSISGFVKIPRTVVVRGASISVVEIGTSAFQDCSGLTAVDIPSSVTKIGQRAFQDCSGLTEVAIPYGVTEIRAWAFCGCSGLTAVTIPSSVTKIERHAFLYCRSLKEVTIPRSVTWIAWGAFCDCSGLKAVTIPKSVTWIEDEAFYGCSSLTAVTIPSSVTGIGWDVFNGCSSLTTVTINGGVKTIGKAAFKKCEKLTSLTISDGVTAIGKYAFDGCSGLTRVTIPSSVTAIGENAFLGCSGLNAVYWLADANCIVGVHAFFVIAHRATLYVRQGEKAAIEKMGWAKEYFSAVEEGYVVTFKDSDGNELGEQLVEPNGRATAPAAPTKEGFTFVEWQLEGAKAGYGFTTPVAEDITLVAVWKKAVKYTVTFNANGGTPTPYTQMVDEGKEASEPAAPTRKGYTFVEWQLDDGKSRYEFSTPVTKDITLVAKWKKNEESTPKDPKTAVESVQLAGVRAVRNPMGEALELEGMERAARVEVYSVVGERVHAEALRGEPRVVIDARGWASGVYVVRVVASDGERKLRVVK